VWWFLVRLCFFWAWMPWDVMGWAAMGYDGMGQDGKWDRMELQRNGMGTKTL